MGAGEGRSDRVGGAGRRRPTHAPTALQPALLTLMPSLRTILAADVANGKQKSEAGAGGGRGLVAAAQRARRPAPLCTGASTVGAWDQPGQHVRDVNCTGGLALDSRLCRTVAGGPGARRPPSAEGNESAQHCTAVGAASFVGRALVPGSPPQHHSRPRWCPGSHCPECVEACSTR